MKILIVHDQTPASKKIQEIIQHEGHEVLIAANCQEALKMLLADGFELILSDILPPVMSGFQLCFRCKNDEKIKQIPFIFYSNLLVNKEYVKYALEIGADGFLNDIDNEALFTHQVQDLLLKIKTGQIKGRSAVPGLDISRIRDHSQKMMQDFMEISTRYKTLFECAGDGIMILKDYRFVECNQQARLMFAAKPDQIIGRTPYELSPEHQPDGQRSKEKALALMNAALAGTPLFFEWRHRKCDGSLFDAEVSLRVMNLPPGAFLLALVRDVTARKKAEQAEQVTKELFRAIFESAQDVIFIKNRNLRYIQINPAFARLFKTTPENIIGKSDEELFDAASAALIKAEDQRVMAGELVETQTIKKIDGEPRYFHTIKAPLRDQRGKIWGLCGIARDRTEQERMSANLKKNEEFLRTITDNINEVIFAINMDLRFTYVSSSIKRLGGYSPEEFLTLSPEQVLTPESYRQEMLILNQNLNKVNQDLSGSLLLELENIRKDGSRFWTETAFKFLLNDQNQPISILGVARDISEIRQVHQELRKSYDNLKDILQGTVMALASAVEKRDPYTAGHQRRVSQLACALAREMGLSDEVINYLGIAALLHDVGKLYIPAEILAKPTKLTQPEFEIIKTHSRAGYDILRSINFPWPVAQIVLQHHEKNDGSGYPDHLTGDKILLEAKILGIADIVEAMISHRPYREALGLDQALNDIRQGRGAKFDAEIVDACINLFQNKKFSFS